MGMLFLPHPVYLCTETVRSHDACEHYTHVMCISYCWFVFAVPSGDTLASTVSVKSANSASRKLESASTCSSRLNNDGAYPIVTDFDWR